MAKWKTLSSVQFSNPGRPHWLAVLWLLSALLLSACGGSGGDGGNPNDPNNPTELKDPQLTLQSDAAVTLNVGSTHINTASSTNGSTGSISYASTDTEIADVDGNGLVTAKAIGDTTITVTIEATATHKASSVSYDVTVVALQEAGLEFANSGPVILGIGNSQTNTANSANGSTGSISYTSQNESVAEVDGNGLVTAKAIGDTTITATIDATATHKEGSATYSISVGLNDPALQIANSGVVTLRINDTHLTQIINKEGDGDIRYESDNPSVADIDSEGLVTAKAVGNATITVKVIETESYAADSATYSIDVIGSGGTLSLWLEEDGAQWQMPKGFAGADFYGTTEADCPYESGGGCSNATIKTNLDDGELFDDDGNDTTALNLDNTLAFYQLTHKERTAQGLLNTQKWEPRKNHQAVYYNDRFWVMGGNANINNLMSTVKDLWSSPDGKNWQEEAAFPEAGRSGHQMVVYDIDGEGGNGEQLVLIAGRTGKRDIWTFDNRRTPHWDKLYDAPFAAREGHQVVVFNDRLWVIGGLDKNNGNTVLSDAWAFKPSGQGPRDWVKESEDDFPERYQHQAVVFDGKLWVMGGLDVNDDPLNDVWVLDAQEQGWTDVTTATGADRIDPSKRAHFELAVYNDRLWLIGGKTDAAGDNSLNDVWSLGKGAGATWQPELEEAPFAVRNGHQVVVARDRMWLFGGGKQDNSNGRADVKNDVWSTADGKLWRLESTEPEIGARSGHQVVTFAPTDADGNAGERRLWLIGGTGQPTNDVWSSLDGVNWTLATDTALFAARYDHSLAEFEGRLWLVGGRDQDDITLGDAWSSADGVEWRDEADRLPDNFPALAESQLVVFNEQLWLFGGADNDGSNTNEVWSLEQGADEHWQKRQSNFPSRRSHQIAVFNGGSTDQLIMSGGVEVQLTTQNDVWLSNDGLQWNKQSDQSSSLYTQRDKHQMVVINDETSLAPILIVMGGTSDGDASGALSDIWISTDGGKTWTPAVSDAPFGKVFNHQVVRFNDGTGDKLWLIGGELIGNQIWRSEDGINWQRLVKSDFQFAEPESSPAP